MEKKKYSKRYCRYTEAQLEFIDWLTGNTKRWQERVEVAIKRARHMALIPYVVDRKKVIENPFKI